MAKKAVHAASLFRVHDSVHLAGLPKENCNGRPYLRLKKGEIRVIVCGNRLDN